MWILLRLDNAEVMPDFTSKLLKWPLPAMGISGLVRPNTCLTASVLVCPDCAAPPQELWKVWKELGSEESLHAKVQLSFPNLSHRPLLCPQEGAGVRCHRSGGKSVGSQIK